MRHRKGFVDSGAMHRQAEKAPRVPLAELRFRAFVIAICSASEEICI